jgi:hypothetical protein
MLGFIFLALGGFAVGGGARFLLCALLRRLCGSRSGGAVGGGYRGLGNLLIGLARELAGGSSRTSTIMSTRNEVGALLTLRVNAHTYARRRRGRRMRSRARRKIRGRRKRRRRRRGRRRRRSRGRRRRRRRKRRRRRSRRRRKRRQFTVSRVLALRKDPCLVRPLKLLLRFPSCVCVKGFSLPLLCIQLHRLLLGPRLLFLRSLAVAPCGLAL